MDKAIPERVWIDRGPRGGWMMRDKKMPDSEHEYVRTDLMPAALTAAGWRLVPPGVDGETVEPPAERFARWLEMGPRLAKEAGCYVGIKVTEAKARSTMGEG